MNITIEEKQDNKGITDGTLQHSAEVSKNGCKYPVGIEEMITNGNSVYAITWLGDEPFIDSDEQEFIEEAVIKAFEQAEPIEA